MRYGIVRWMLIGSAVVATACANTKTEGLYYFGKGRVPSGYTFVAPQSGYTDSRGYGWKDDRPNVFVAKLPEGNYNVSVIFDDEATARAATVKAEARRLMLRSDATVDGRQRRFTVNIRQPQIEGGDRVKLNSRETDPVMIAHWDDMLFLEFLPGKAGVTAVKIEPAPEAVTVYIAGDSTVTDQRSEPWSGWGQMLPSCFEPGVAVANHAESGRALFSFLWEKRFDKILDTMKPGDYLFIQFGHNDQKDKRDGAGPFTTYKRELEEYIAKVRAKKANVVLVTPMERRRWKGAEPQETLTDYAEAMRQVGKEQKVPVVDLHAMSLKFYAALGAEGSTKAFVHYPANSFPGQDKGLKDDTHHNVYGAYELARCVVEGIKAQVPELAKHLRAEPGAFDPSKPDNPDLLGIPASSEAGAETPEGN